MSAPHAAQIRALVEACHLAARHNLVRCSSGNLSCRLNTRLAAIKASRAWMEDLGPRDISVCRIADGRVVRGRKPSVETELHLGVYRVRPDVGAVLHFQSPFATAVACGDPARWNFHVIPEVAVYIQSIAIVDYLPPGSPELAAATISAMRKHNLAILRNHGLVAAGANLRAVIQQAAFFELTCEILLRGRGLRPLPRSAIARLMAAGRAGGPA